MIGSSNTVRYVFGVSRRGAPLPTVDPGPLCSALDMVDDGDLVALTGETRTDDLVGPRTDELSWILPRADAHDRVLSAWTRSATVVPCRFGAAFEDEDGVRTHLRDHADQLGAALAQIDGAVEYTVVLRADPDAARSAGRTGTGRDYLRARGRQLAGTDVARAQGRVAQLLDELGARARPLPARPGEVRLACLLPRARAREAVGQLESQPPEIVVDVRGPHPAYHFAELGGPSGSGSDE